MHIYIYIHTYVCIYAYIHTHKSYTHTYACVKRLPVHFLEPTPTRCTLMCIRVSCCAFFATKPKTQNPVCYPYYPFRVPLSRSLALALALAFALSRSHSRSLSLSLPGSHAAECRAGKKSETDTKGDIKRDREERYVVMDVTDLI